MMYVRQKLKWLAVVMLAWSTLMLGCGSSSGDDPLMIHTASGTLRGAENESSRYFKGIPFAQPPVGDLRWKAPQDPVDWSDTLDASESQNVCVQTEMSTTWHASGQLIGSEDCLYLDVYRPNNDEKNLPVYVFFHGGANRFGGASLYDGSYLANDQNIIVVIPQYRLGPLGWFRHASLRTGDQADDSGNFGTLDNIKALEWVNQNIADFGGDPSKVTIGGQSAGASNVAKLLISPLAVDLFQGAVMQSIGGTIITPEEGDALSQEMLTTMGYDETVDGDDVSAFLYGKTAEEITQAYSTTHAGFSDGYVLPGRYVDMIYYEEYNSVPVLLGSTEYEFKDFLPLYAASFGYPNWANVYDLFDPDFDPDYQWTYQEIFPTQAEADLYEAMGKYQSAGWKYKSVDELAALLKSRQDGVYAYLFQWGGVESASEDFAHIFGSAHAMDIPFFFGYDHDLFEYALTDENRAGFEDLQQIMMTYLGNFIRTGNPGAAGGVTWQEWSNEATSDAPKCIHLNADMTAAQVEMNSEKLSSQGLWEAALAETDGWPESDANLVLAMLNTSPAGDAEYLFNDENHELLLANLAFESTEGFASDVYWGVHAQAGYQIEIPENWSAQDHDLVMYAHGYRGEEPELSVSQPTNLRNYLMENNIAWAASSYTANSYNIVSGVESTAELLAYFKANFGEPRRVYLVGHSMGGHITARTVADSDYKNDYAGALPLCGVVGGATDLFNYHLDWGLTASYFAQLNYDLPYSATDLGVLSETIFNPSGDQVGALGEIPPSNASFDGTEASLNEAGEYFRDAVMYRSGGLRPIFDNAFSFWARFMIENSMARLLDPSAGLGLGNIVGNTSTDYPLDSDDILYTSAQEEDLNAQIVRVEDPTADFSALMWPVSGEIEIPVLTLHNIGDMYVPFSMEQLWAERIRDAGNGNLFRTRAIRAIGHCDFTQEEETQAFSDLVDWVETGWVPGGEDILSTSVVEADDFGCTYTSEARPLEDPDYDSVCLQ